MKEKGTISKIFKTVLSIPVFVILAVITAIFAIVKKQNMIQNKERKLKEKE